MDVPRLLVAFFPGPFVPALGGDDRTAVFQQTAPVAVAQLLHPSVDTERHLAVGPARTVAPEHIVDAAFAILDVQKGPIGSGRDLEGRRRRGGVPSVGPG